MPLRPHAERPAWAAGNAGAPFLEEASSGILTLAKVKVACWHVR